ncbi:MAG: hypothetical protein RLY20_3527 [Verrucomicrobiota bacterium]
MNNPLRARPLTGLRIFLALTIAVVADGLQLGGTLIGGPLAAVGFVEAVDVIAMILTVLLLGFHPLLLPTFVVEFIPVIDMLPTWTGCVGAVLLLHKRAQTNKAEPPTASPPAQTEAPKPPQASGPVIDV